MRPMLRLKKIEFYINNTCNLSCSGCNRFNDLHFKGWQSWDDYKDDYTLWAKYLSIDEIVILGGEPLLNPTLPQWIKGIQQLWPKATIQILTNGTYLDRVKGIYELCGVSIGTWIGVSVHEETDFDIMIEQAHKFLRAPVKELKLDKSDYWMGGADKTFIDENEVIVRLYKQTDFMRNALLPGKEKRFTLHNNQPELAHSNCGFAQHKNYHFIKGKMYKCGPVALFPELDDQFDLELSDDDKQLIRSYKPLSAQTFGTESDEFFSTLDNVIPQCKFCNTLPDWHPLEFVHKKGK